MRKLIISVIVILCILFAGMAYAAVPQDDPHSHGASTSAQPTPVPSGNVNMQMMGCMAMHKDMMDMMSNMIDIQKELVATIKDNNKKQELQKKLGQMEEMMKQMKQYHDQNCGMMNNMNNMQNMMHQ